jgi:CelD/BcsL family acetyltransferase involved in cellulose biosynthesis
MLFLHSTAFFQRFAVTISTTPLETVTIIESTPDDRSKVRELVVEEVTTREEFENLSAEWDGLVSRLSRPSVYLTHAWFSTWWRCHSSRHTSIFVLLVRREGELVAIAPLMKIEGRFLGIPHRRLEFISMMHHAYSPLNCSGSLEVIIADDPHGVMSALTRHISSCRSDWDMVRLNPLPEDSWTLSELLHMPSERGLRCVSRMVYHNAVVEIGGQWDAYVAGRSKLTRKHLRAFERTVASRDDITLIEYRTLEELPGGFDALLAIEKKSWKSRKGFSLDAPEYRDFYRLVADAMARAGRLRIVILTVGGRNVAYDLCLEYAGRIESLKSSYDPELRDISPGGILTMLEIRQMFKESKLALNLLWGDLSYKYRWATTVVPHHEVFLFHGGLYSRFLHFLFVRLSLYRLARYLWNAALRQAPLRSWLEKKGRII